MTTEQLIKNCKKGNIKAQRGLVDKYSAMLFSVCRRYCRDHALAKDALQETFINIFTHLNKYKNKGSFEGWMRTIAVRSSLRQIRTNDFSHDFTQNTLEEHLHTQPDVYMQFEVETLIKILQLLPPGYRVILNLFEIEGYSHKEIADLLEISESTSRSQLSRARQLLKSKLIEHNKITVL